MRADAKIIFTGPSPRGWHRLQQAAECLQKYGWGYESPEALESRAERKSGGRPKRPSAPPLAKGSLIHLALAQHYARMKADQNGEDVEAWCEPERAVNLISKFTRDEKHAELAIDVYRRYCDIYPDDIYNMRILEVESLYQTTIADKYLFTGRMDLVWEDVVGRVKTTDHKCLPGSEEVNGVLVSELFEASQQRPPGRSPGFPVRAMNGGQHLIDAVALPPVDAGVQDVYALRLKNGTSLRLGYKHPVWTRQRKGVHPNNFHQPEWVRADALRPGDEVAVGLGAAVMSSTPSPVHDTECWMAGALIADGALTNEDFKLTKKDEKVREAYMDAARRFGFDVKERFPDSASRSPFVATQGGKLLVSWAARIGLDLVVSPERRIPKAMRSLCQVQTGVLLGALWSGDGAIYTSKDGSKLIPRITYGTRSKWLAEDVQQALLNMGIPANVQSTTVTYKGKKLPYFYATVVTKFGKARFCKLAIEGVIPLVRSAEPAQDVLRAVMQASDKGNGKIEGDLWWVKVSSNLFEGQERCFDIEVPVHHTFLVKGVVTHNTTGRLTTKHAEYYTVSGQLIGYRHLAQERWGERFAGMHLNLVQHGGNMKFERLDLPRSPNLEARFEQIVVDIEESIERMKSTGRTYDDWPKSTNELTCYHRYGPCNFMAQCRMGAGAKKAGNWKWEG